MNRVSPTEVWNRVSMNVYRFINRSIGVPPDLREQPIPFLLPFFLLFPLQTQ